MSCKNKGERISESKHIIILKVLGQDTADLHFKIRKQTILLKLMRAYCDRKGLSMLEVHFMFNGDRITYTDTPMSLKMEEGDTINVFQK